MRHERRSWRAAPGSPTIAARVERALADLERPSLRPRHQRHRRRPAHQPGTRPAGPARRCSPATRNLEYDLAAGRRGKRDIHTGGLLERLLGAPGIAVNNNAAAVFLALHELAAGGEVIVSRGELIEIGDGFRIPDIMARSGAVLREVGTTNRTRIDDYRDAITDRTRLLHARASQQFPHHRIHRAPRIARTRRPRARARHSGLRGSRQRLSWSTSRAFGIDEPLVSDSLTAGADLVSFSGDKLLGGPQAGILAGQPRSGRAPAPQSAVSRAAARQADLPGARDHPAQPAAGTLGRGARARHDAPDAPTEIRARAEALLARVPGLRAEVVDGQFGDRRRRHSGAIDSHLADRRRLRRRGGRRTPPARGRSARDRAHRRRDA